MKKTREILKSYKEQRIRIRAKVLRFGKKPAFRGPPVDTILLIDVIKVDDNSFLTDHIWFTKGKWCDGIQVADQIELDARVKTYTKGYFGYKEDVAWEKPAVNDYKFSNPSKVVILK